MTVMCPTHWLITLESLFIFYFIFSDIMQYLVDSSVSPVTSVFVFGWIAETTICVCVQPDCATPSLVQPCTRQTLVACATYPYCSVYAVFCPWNSKVSVSYCYSISYWKRLHVQYLKNIPITISPLRNFNNFCSIFGESGGWSQCLVSFSGLTLLGGWQEGYLTCKTYAIYTRCCLPEQVEEGYSEGTANTGTSGKRPLKRR